MAKVTRIKAGDHSKTEEVKEKVKDVQPKKVEKPKQKSEKNPAKKPFILIRPIVYFFRYLRDSWREIRQVRWPSRKATWKLFFAILIYTLLFGAIIMLLDALFSWIFNLIVG